MGGAARLRAAGIEVELGLLEREAADQNAAFLHNIRDPVATVRRAEARDDARRAHRRRERKLALDLRAPRLGSSSTGCGQASTPSASAASPRGPTIRRSPSAGAVQSEDRAAPCRLRRRRRHSGEPDGGQDGQEPFHARDRRARGAARRGSSRLARPGWRCSHRPTWTTRSRRFGAAASVRSWSKGVAGWPARCCRRTGRPVLLDPESRSGSESARFRRRPDCRRRRWARPSAGG